MYNRHNYSSHPGIKWKLPISSGTICLIPYLYDSSLLIHASSFINTVPLCKVHLELTMCIHRSGDVSQDVPVWPVPFGVTAHTVWKRYLSQQFLIFCHLSPGCQALLLTPTSTRNKVSPAFLAFIGKDDVGDEGQIKPVIRENSLFLLSFISLVPLTVGGDSSFQDDWAPDDEEGFQDGGRTIYFCQMSSSV